jgi:hypothetical protein
MEDIATAALLGLSLGNLWICALVVFALQTSDKWACGGYLAGRFVGILAFTFIFWLVGGMIDISHSWINIISGIAMLLFVAYFYSRYVAGWVPFWVKKKPAHVHVTSGEDHSNCGQDCNTCPVHHDEEWKDHCDDCADEKACSAEDFQIEPITRQAQVKWGRDPSEERVAGFMGGFTLGGIRGSAMCGRLVILLPLVMTGTLGHAAVVGGTFALTSTVYPLLGMALGAVILKVLPHRKMIFNISAVILLFVAGFYLVKGISMF